MKMWWGTIALGIVFIGPPAVAAPWDFRPSLQAQQDRRPPPRQAPAYKGERGERRDQRAAPEREERPRQRLSDEERRDLRRDIDRADRELYRRKGQR